MTIVVTVLVCRRFGVSPFRFVVVLACRRFGLSSFRRVAVSVCRRSGVSSFRLVVVLVVWSSPKIVVAVSVCRRFDYPPPPWLIYSCQLTVL